MATSAMSAILLLLTILHLRSEILSVTALPDQNLDYLKFVYNASDLSFSGDEYDYIVIGGGTAGCPLAATLSQKYSVLVLERGGVAHVSPNVLHKEGFLINLLQADDRESATQAFTSEDGVLNARGRVLGGSSMINAGFYSRAEEDFYLKSGIEWDMFVVNEAYQWIEQAIVFPPNITVWQSAVKQALLEADIGPDNGFSLDHVKGTKVGGSVFDGAGRRHGAVELLNRAEPNNLLVAVHATVERIIFSSSNSSGLSAVGVIYSDAIGKSHEVMLRGNGEVILSAGAIGSPQLLLLSGIGPRQYLSSLQIPVILHQPNVGQFLYDNPRNGINIIPPFPLEQSLIQVVGITGNGSYIEAASNVVPFFSPPHFSLFPDPSLPIYVNVATLMEKVSGPRSIGSLTLGSSTDVRVSPIVRFNYLTDPIDLARCVTGMQIIGKMMATQSMDQFKSQGLLGRRSFRFLGPTLPENLSDTASIETFCQRTVTTIWHYHGGCLVGKVVDGDFRVIGINALRIVDGSTLTVSPGTNPQATLMMLGRYVGLKIIEEAIIHDGEIPW
ncbi:(R)-mandelonitrile lyase-like [Malania oleifera]|uniref:(R)-mandelonitrile lyase-like n=1 Tax=Malania oleifera TaxID=397392 RepID=UPI0025AE5DB7|nr:(R)-mandelonitrile lyase-like [Malania oleifera]